MTFNKKAFTLVELLLAVSVLGILAAVTISIINPAKQRENARNGVRMSSMSKFAAALGVYYNDKGKFPSSNADLTEFNAFVGQYLEPNMVSFPSTPGGSTFILFCMQPDISECTAGSSLKKYFYKLTTDANNNPTVRLGFTTNIASAIADGLCWGPNRNSGIVYKLTNPIATCL